MRRLVIVMAWMLALIGVIASPAQAHRGHHHHRGPPWPPRPLDRDYAQTSLNIIPSGQLGGLPVPPGANRQALMYDGLTPLFDQVTNSDLTTYFKTERFGIDTSGTGYQRAGPARRGDDHPRPVPRPARQRDHL